MPSRAGEDLERLKRALVLDLFLQRGSFWEAVLDVRRRWKIEPSTQVPPISFDTSPYRVPGSTEWKNDQWVQWHKDMEYLRSQATLEGHFSRSISRQFFEACVLYDPPDTGLLEYAERFPLGATLLIDDGVRAGLTKEEVLSMPHMVSPPIKHICNPNELLDIQLEFTNRLLHEVNERHLKPKGLNLESMIADVVQTTPLLREYLAKKDQLWWRARPYIAPVPHHGKADLEEAIDIVLAVQPERPRGGRRPLDELVAVYCALLHDKYNESDPTDRRVWRWTYKSLHKEFQEYGVRNERSAEEHVKRGRGLLAARRKISKNRSP